MSEVTSIARNNLWPPWKCAGVDLCRMMVLLLVVWPVAAAPPVISKIELYGSNQVLVHFDVQPNTTCTLQWTDSVKTKTGSINWSNLWISPNLPFFEHYIIPDTGTKTQRFYRLQVGP